jgi:glycerol-3-phosphate dehydrogenase
MIVFPLTTEEATKATQQEFDVIVVGSGAGGGAVAAE